MKKEIYNQKMNVYDFTEEEQKLILNKNIKANDVAKILNLSPKLISSYRYRYNSVARATAAKASKVYKTRYNVRYPMRRWSDEEDELIMTSDLPDRELSGVIKRSMCAIQAHRTILRRAANNNMVISPRVNSSYTLENMVSAYRKEYIKNHYATMKYSDIAKNLNISVNYVYVVISKLRKAGEITYYKKNYNGGLSDKMQFIKDNYLTMEYDDIANAINLSKNTVQTYINKLRRCGEITEYKYRLTDEERANRMTKYSNNKAKKSYIRQFIKDNYLTMKYKDIAEFLNISIATVYNYINRLINDGEIPCSKQEALKVTSMS